MQKILKKIAKYSILSVYIGIFFTMSTSFVLAEVPMVEFTQTTDSVIFNGSHFTGIDSVNINTTNTSQGGSPQQISASVDSSGNFSATTNSTFTIGNTYSFEVFDPENTLTTLVTGSFIFTGAGSSSAAGSVDLTTGAAAVPECTAGPDGYCLLAPIGGLSEIYTADLPDYFNTVYKIGIGIAAVLAIIMLVFGGVQYMSTDAISGKADGKSKMSRAVFGLILALGSFVILNTVNPRLLNFTFNIDQATISVNPDEIEIGIPPPVSSDGKYCVNQNGGQGYSDGSFWDQNLAADSALRQQLSGTSSITVSNGGCETVGQQSCTSLAGLDTSGVLKIRDKCGECELVITGGTECWLHTAKTAHAKNASIVDLRNTGTPKLKAYVEARANIKKKIDGWGQLYVVDGIEFINEGNHYHIWGYNGEHASQYQQ